MKKASTDFVTAARGRQKSTPAYGGEKWRAFRVFLREAQVEAQELRDQCEDARAAEDPVVSGHLNEIETALAGLSLQIAKAEKECRAVAESLAWIDQAIDNVTDG